MTSSWYSVVTASLEYPVNRPIPAVLSASHRDAAVETRADRCERCGMNHGLDSDKFGGKRESGECSLLQVGVCLGHMTS